MTRETRAAGLWPRREQADEAAPIGATTFGLAPPAPAVPIDDDLPLNDPSRRTMALLCIGAAAAWLGLLTAVYSGPWSAQPPSFAEIAGALTTAAAPLALIALLFVLFTRHDSTAQRAAAAAAAQLNAEQQRLEQSIERIAERLKSEYADLAATQDRLMSLGEEAGHRLKTASEGMREEVETLTRYGQSLKVSATSARADMAVLLADLPKAQVETRQMVAALQEAGLAAHERAGALDGLLASLAARGREADEIAGGAAQKLAAHLARVESVSETSGVRLEEAAQRMTDAIDATLARAAEANETARSGIDAQAAAMTALVDQTQSALMRTGTDAAVAISARVEDVSARLQGLGVALSEQTARTGDLLTSVREALGDIDRQLAELDAAGTARAQRLGASVGSLDDNARALADALEAGSAKAAQLIERAETLMTALDASARELDETLPAAIDRLDAKLAATAPQLAGLSGGVSATLDRLIEADAIVVRHRAAIEAVETSAGDRLAAGRAAASEFVEIVAKADEAARNLAEGAGAQLVEALVRVRETSNSAAERAREAIAAVIPQAVGHLSEQTRIALADAISGEIEKQLGQLRTTADAAIGAATDASERLMRQMLTIAETTAAVESRIDTARSEVEDAAKENISRRVALLIEALNSTAIDVAKILSNDVTDSAWAAYLRGDRGVFTRRAVRLLDAGESREVLRHYEADPEFRDQVNRYVHDFEAMLRNILATRDGSPLAVTLLSSDMGKLYVALAQAIDRLRT